MKIINKYEIELNDVKTLLEVFKQFGNELKKEKEKRGYKWKCVPKTNFYKRWNKIIPNIKNEMQVRYIDFIDGSFIFIRKITIKDVDKSFRLINNSLLVNEAGAKGNDLHTSYSKLNNQILQNIDSVNCDTIIFDFNY
jgi:hypothetical protein